MFMELIAGNGNFLLVHYGYLVYIYKYLTSQFKITKVNFNYILLEHYLATVLYLILEPRIYSFISI